MIDTSYGSMSRLMEQYSRSTTSWSGFGSDFWTSHHSHTPTFTRKIFIALVGYPNK